MRKHKLQQLVLPQSQPRQLEVLEDQHRQATPVAGSSQHSRNYSRQQLFEGVAPVEEQAEGQEESLKVVVKVVVGLILKTTGSRA